MRESEGERGGRVGEEWERGERGRERGGVVRLYDEMCYGTLNYTVSLSVFR